MTDLDLRDPERLLALSYANARVQPAIRALWCLDEMLGDFIARTENPVAGQIRLTWWHDSLGSLKEQRPVDPLLRALADTPGINAGALVPLIDGWEVLLDPLPLPDHALRAYASARGGTLFRETARLLDWQGACVEDAGRLWALVDLAFRISDRETAARALALAPGWQGKLPAPLAVLAALARRDLRKGLDHPRRQGGPARVIRAIAAGLTGR